MPEVITDGPKTFILVLSLVNWNKMYVHPAFNVSKTFKKIRHRTAIIFNSQIKLSLIGIGDLGESYI